MDGKICTTCSLIILSKKVSEVCPLCHSSAIEEKKDIVHKMGDVTNISESEKKHIPAITVVKKCGLVEGCTDVHVKVGEIIHPMTKEHYINNIDFYINDEFVARTELRPDIVNPAAAIHLKVSTGKITVIERCNIHGAWISQTEL